MIYTRRYGTATGAGAHIPLPLVKAGATQFATGADWTPATGDVKVSKDGAAPADAASLPTYVGAAGKRGFWLFPLSASELTCKSLVLTINAAAVEDNGAVIETVGHPSAMYPSDPTADNTAVESRYTAAAGAIATGVVGSGTNTAGVISIAGGAGGVSPSALAANQFKGKTLTFSATTATTSLRSVSVPIDASDTASLTIAAGYALPVAASNGDTFVLT